MAKFGKTKVRTMPHIYFTTIREIEVTCSDFLNNSGKFIATFAFKKFSKIYSNIYIQQDATLHSLFYLETALHVSGGTITQHQQRIQLYLQHLVFVTPLLLSAAIVEEMELV